MAFHANARPFGANRREKRDFGFNAVSALSIPFMILLLVFVLLPFFFIILYSFLQKVPNSDKLYLTFANFSSFITNATYTKATWLSLWFALLTTLICLGLGYPVGYFMARTNPRKRRIMVMAITIPMWINMLLRILAWKQIFQLITSWTGIELDGTRFAVVFGMVYDFLPFMIIPIYTSVLKIDPALYEASKDLGANSFKTFFRVTLPLSMPGIISGITMVFLPAATSLIVPMKLGNRMPLIGYLIETFFKEMNDYYLGSAAAVVLSLTMLLLMFLIGKLDRSSVKDDQGSRKKRFKDISPLGAGGGEIHG